MVLGIEMIKPEGIEVEDATLTPEYGKLTVEPLERGYGYTMGNALRRVLLSSLTGAAVTGVEVEGALHEFSSIPDVREDVTELILNLKQVRFKMHSAGPETLTLDVKGKGVATAGDFETNQNIEVVNPKHILAHIGEGARLQLRVIVETGRGFRAGDENQNPDWPLGTIGVDSIFSPVRKVNFEVSNARVGQRTDYDKLVFEIHTDGSVTPQDALAIAAGTLQDQLSVFSGLATSSGAGAQASEAVAGSLNPVFLRPVKELELQNRTLNSLESAGISYLGDLVQMTETAVSSIKNFGKKSLSEVKELLDEMGLTLGMKIEGWPPASIEQAAEEA